MLELYFEQIILKARLDPGNLLKITMSNRLTAPNEHRFKSISTLIKTGFQIRQDGNIYDISTSKEFDILVNSTFEIGGHSDS